MDRTQDCGSCNRGSIPLEGTILEIVIILKKKKVSSFYKVFLLLVPIEENDSHRK